MTTYWEIASTYRAVMVRCLRCAELADTAQDAFTFNQCAWDWRGARKSNARAYLLSRAGRTPNNVASLFKGFSYGR